jgi:hypothetical protein
MKIWKIPQNIVPPKGWHFITPFNGVKIESHSENDLRAKVIRYYNDQGQSLEGLQDQITAFICSLGSSVCQQVEVTYSHGVAHHQIFENNFDQTFLDNANTLLDQGGLGFVETPQAEDRAAVCHNCPLNRKVAMCPSCAGHGLRITALILKGRRTTHDGYLNECQGYAVDCKLLVHLAGKCGIEAREQIPNHCWRRHL